jgi:hypothetical protein
MGEVVGAFRRRKGIEGMSDRLPRDLAGSGRGVAQQGLELGEGKLDRVEVGALGRQVEEPRTRCVDGLAHAGDLVRLEPGRSEQTKTFLLQRSPRFLSYDQR